MSRFYHQEQQKEDIAQETLSMLSEQVGMALYAYWEKDAKKLHDALFCIYWFIMPELKEAEAMAFKQSLDDAAKIIYSDKYRDPVEASKIFDKLIPLFLRTSPILHSMGMLYGVKTDINTLVAGGKR